MKGGGGPGKERWRTSQELCDVPEFPRGADRSASTHHHERSKHLAARLKARARKQQLVSLL